MRQRERRQRGEIDRRGCGWRAGHARFAPFLYGGIGCAVRRGFRIRRDHHRRGIDWRRHTGDQRAGAGCELGEHVTKDRVPAVKVRRGRPLLDLVGAAVLDKGAQLDAALPFAARRVIDGRAARRADAHGRPAYLRRQAAPVCRSGLLAVTPLATRPSTLTRIPGWSQASCCGAKRTPSRSRSGRRATLRASGSRRCGVEQP